MLLISSLQCVLNFSVSFELRGNTSLFQKNPEKGFEWVEIHRRSFRDERFRIIDFFFFVIISHVDMTRESGAFSYQPEVGGDRLKEINLHMLIAWANYLIASTLHIL